MKRAELEATDEQFRLMVESVKDYAILLDPEGRVASWNAGAERIKGYRADEITGKHFSIFYSKKDVKAGKPQSELEIARSQSKIQVEGFEGTGVVWPLLTASYSTAAAEYGPKAW